MGELQLFLRGLKIRKALQTWLLAGCFILAFFVPLQKAGAQATLSQSDSARLDAYNNKALNLLNKYRYDESLDTLAAALKIHENARTYYLIEHIHSNKQDWDDVIYYGEKAVSMDSSYMPAYFDLFLGYLSVGRWDEAKAIGEKARKGDEQHSLTSTIDSMDYLIDSGKRSALVVTLLFLVLAGVFSYSVYRATRNGGGEIERENLRFSEVLVVSAAVSAIFYILFYMCSHWIWAQNKKVAIADFSYLVRMAAMEHDGVESYFLFGMFSLVVFMTLVVTAAVIRLRNKKTIYWGLSVALLLLAAYYFFHIGFFPPEPSVYSEYLMVPVIMSAFSAGLYALYHRNKLWAKIIVIGLIAFAGLIPLSPPSTLDFNFLLSPALRLYHGVKIHDIYFQYDYFLSFIAYAWMKLNIGLESYPYIFTFSFFLFFLATFFFTDKFFRAKGLSVIFIVAMIVARVYIISHDNALIPQVTPIRLDLWIILLMIAYFKGVRHWGVGVALGLLVLFHRNLGLIYLVSYLELLVVLFLVDAYSLVVAKKKNAEIELLDLPAQTLPGLIAAHFKLNWKNLAIVVSSIALCFILFHEMFSAAALAYQKLGINFLPIHRHSFYWYFPLVVACLLVFVLFYRKRLGERYTSTALFIVVLAIANSMYFYGRSHENNVLNLTGILTLTLFVLFDLLVFHAPEAATPTAAEAPSSQVPLSKKNSVKNAPGKKMPVKSEDVKKSWLTLRNIYLFLPVLFIFMMCYYYGERIYHKAQTQYNNVVESAFPFPYPLSTMDTAAVRQLTHNSQNVYFIDQQYDFYYCYYGQYVPQGYYTPFCAYVYKKDIVDFVQGLLDKGYYVIYNATEVKSYSEYLPLLRYNQASQLRNIVALKKVNVPLLFPSEASSFLHVGINDTLALPGMDYSTPDIHGDITMEVLVKPIGDQPTDASIVNNLTLFPGDKLKGFVLQKNGPTPDIFVIGFSDGTPNVPNVPLRLERNVWHYVVATVNKQTIMVYDNGKLVGSANSGGGGYLNSDLPITIGNRSARDAHFSGYIREVRIAPGNIDASEVSARLQRLNQIFSNTVAAPAP